MPFSKEHYSNTCKEKTQQTVVTRSLIILNRSKDDKVKNRNTNVRDTKI